MASPEKACMSQLTARKYRDTRAWYRATLACKGCPLTVQNPLCNVYTCQKSSDLSLFLLCSFSERLQYPRTLKSAAPITGLPRVQSARQTISRRSCGALTSLFKRSVPLRRVERSTKTSAGSRAPTMSSSTGSRSQGMTRSPMSSRPTRLGKASRGGRWSTITEPIS